MSLTNLKIPALKPKEIAFKVFDDHGLYIQLLLLEANGDVSNIAFPIGKADKF